MERRQPTQNCARILPNHTRAANHHAATTTHNHHSLPTHPAACLCLCHKTGEPVLLSHWRTIHTIIYTIPTSRRDISPPDVWWLCPVQFSSAARRDISAQKTTKAQALACIEQQRFELFFVSVCCALVLLCTQFSCAHFDCG